MIDGVLKTGRNTSRLCPSLLRWDGMKFFDPDSSAWSTERVGTVRGLRQVSRPFAGQIDNGH